MGDKFNEKAFQEMAIASIARDEGFRKLSELNQELILNGMSGNKTKDGGIMGKFFGVKKDNASMNIAFCICVLLAIIGGFCSLAGKDYWNVIIPAITTGMGYMFGKGDR